MITELWTVTGTTTGHLVPNVEHHTNCEVPEAEVMFGVKEIMVHAYGDTTPPNAFVQVTAAGEELARRLLEVVIESLNLSAWWNVARQEEIIQRGADRVRRYHPSIADELDGA